MDDDTGFLDWPESSDGDADPTARSIEQCLRILADEAAVLGLARTLAALQAAIEVCGAEGDAMVASGKGGDIRLHAASSSSVH